MNKMKWTYNTGVMISNGIRLNQILSDQKYLNEAIESAQGAYNYFVRPMGSLALAYPNHDPWFTTKLIRSFVEIEPYYKNAGNYIKTFINFLDHAYENADSQMDYFMRTDRYRSQKSRTVTDAGCRT